jgi:hypothetical protein
MTRNLFLRARRSSVLHHLSGIAGTVFVERPSPHRAFQRGGRRACPERAKRVEGCPFVAIAPQCRLQRMRGWWFLRRRWSRPGGLVESTNGLVGIGLVLRRCLTDYRQPTTVSNGHFTASVNPSALPPKPASPRRWPDVHPRQRLQDAGAVPFRRVTDDVSARVLDLAHGAADVIHGDHDRGVLRGHVGTLRIEAAIDRSRRRRAAIIGLRCRTSPSVAGPAPASRSELPDSCS